MADLTVLGVTLGGKTAIVSYVNLIPWLMLIIFVGAVAGVVYLVRKNSQANEAWGEARHLVTDSMNAYRGGKLKGRALADDVSLGEFLRSNVQDGDDYQPVMWPKQVNDMTERAAAMTAKAADRAMEKVSSFRKSA